MRIPQALKDALDAAALENKRSLTAEVVARLEESFQAKKFPQMSANDMKELLDTDANAQRMFAEQMYKAGTHLLKADPSLPETTLGLLTAAMLLAEDRRSNPQTAGAPLQKEEAVEIVKAAKPAVRKTKSSQPS